MGVRLQISVARFWLKLVQQYDILLAWKLLPSRATLHRFRDKSKNFIDDVFGQILVLAQKENFLDGNEASIDGTFIDALASRHRFVNQGTLINVRPKSQLRLKRIFKGPSRLIPIACQLGWQRLPAEDWNSNSVLSKPTTFSPRNLKRTAKSKNLSDWTSPRSLSIKSDPGVPISRNKQKVFRTTMANPVCD